ALRRPALSAFAMVSVVISGHLRRRQAAAVHWMRAEPVQAQPQGPYPQRLRGTRHTLTSARPDKGSARRTHDQKDPAGWDPEEPGSGFGGRPRSRTLRPERRQKTPRRRY